MIRTLVYIAMLTTGIILAAAIEINERTAAEPLPAQVAQLAVAE